jgi:hypothetical protein
MPSLTEPGHAIFWNVFVGAKPHPGLPRHEDFFLAHQFVRVGGAGADLFGGKMSPIQQRRQFQVSFSHASQTCHYRFPVGSGFLEECSKNWLRIRPQTGKRRQQRFFQVGWFGQAVFHGESTGKPKRGLQ